LFAPLLVAYIIKYISSCFCWCCWC